METILYRFNPWWEGKKAAEGKIEREKYTSKLSRLLDTKDVVLLTGLRRVGKTTIMKLFIDHLIESGVEPRRIFYVSLDFYGLEKFSILEIVEEFYKTQSISFSDKTYIFLDEVAYKENFSLQLKNLYDLYNTKIFASSSSSSILKDKKATLTGRERIVEILPLDFFEFLKFKGRKIRKSDAHLLESYFENYMNIGGIPEYVLTEDVEYIKQLIDDILYKDIAAYYNIKDKSALREIFCLLMERAGKQISINRLAKILSISPDTVRRFVSYFEETFMVNLVERCGKINERVKSPKKLYVGDVGIRNAVTGFRDKGAVFENLVYITIKNRKPCYIYRNGIEIDFLTEDGILLEIKYKDQLRERQRKLFESLKANKKLLISSVKDFLNLIEKRG
ncbi:ATP-binding protein [Desulfurobacterium sp.]